MNNKVELRYQVQHRNDISMDWTCSQYQVILNKIIWFFAVAGFKGRTTPAMPFTWTTPDGATSVSVDGDRTSGWTLCSSTCPYWMDYDKECEDPRLVIYVDPSYTVDGLRGICKDCNGDPGNDRTPCDRSHGNGSSGSKGKGRESSGSSSKGKSNDSSSGSRTKRSSSGGKGNSGSSEASAAVTMEDISFSCRMPGSHDSNSRSSFESRWSGSSGNSPSNLDKSTEWPQWLNIVIIKTTFMVVPLIWWCSDSYVYYIYFNELILLSMSNDFFQTVHVLVNMC